jgi:hypothetical protein
VTALALLAIAACADEVPPPPCERDTTRCTGTAFEVCVESGWITLEPCEGACDATLGCRTCTPEERACDGTTARECVADGSRYEIEECDPALGLTCDDGRCFGPCARRTLGDSYIGCEYYPVVLGNPVLEEFSFGIAIANASAMDATVLIEGGALAAPETLVVPADSVEVRTLPWVSELKLCSGPAYMVECDPVIERDVRGPAYRVRSTQPIVVYQFNPLEYRSTATGEEHFSFTADASLLLPANTWGTRYLAISRRAFRRWPGEIAITAASDAIVRVTPTASTADAPAGRTTEFTLAPGETLELLSEVEDLTGTLIESDRPVQVISGHFGTEVPLGRPAANHLEESMLPIHALGRHYLVAPPETALERVRGMTVTNVQIVAAEDDVTLAFDPPLEGVPTRLVGAGDSIVIPEIRAPHAISASGRILVAHSLVGGTTYTSVEEEAPLAGDPATAIAVPIDQFREVYVFHAPPSYAQNFVTVFAIPGAIVELDGEPIAAPETPIGGSGYAVRHVALSGDGTHRMQSTEPFGITVYGYGEWTSYLYPGGLDVGALE